jgi:hypothetical protein
MFILLSMNGPILLKIVERQPAKSSISNTTQGHKIISADEPIITPPDIVALITSVMLNLPALKKRTEEEDGYTATCKRYKSIAYSSQLCLAVT